MNFRILETFHFILKLQRAWCSTSASPHVWGSISSYFLMFCPFVKDFGTKDEVWNFKEELATPLLVGAPREDPREERAFFREN